MIKGQLGTVTSIRKCKGEFCEGHCFCFFVFFCVSFCSVLFKIALNFYVTLHYDFLVVHCWFWIRLLHFMILYCTCSFTPLQLYSFIKRWVGRQVTNIMDRWSL